MGKWFFLFTVFCAFFLHALDNQLGIRQYVHKTWTTDDGLPQNFIRAIVQTPDGYLWIGTQQGLARFDGFRFMVYDRWNTPELQPHSISVLCVNGDSLWMGLSSGGIMEKTGERWNIRQTENIKREFMESMCPDRSGRFWLKSDTRNLYCYDRGNCSLVTKLGRYAISAVYSIQRDSSNGLRVFADAGVFYSNGREWTREFSADVYPSGIVPSKVFMDSRKNLWIGTAKAGLYKWDGREYIHFGVEAGLCHPDVRSIFEDRDACIWVGTAGGISRIYGGRIESFTSQDGLSNNEISLFFEDREGSLWIGTNNGLNRLKKGNATNFGKKQGLKDDFVWSVFEDRRGVIWIGTSNLGLDLMQEGKVSDFSGNSLLPSKTVRCIYEDAEGGFWFGTTDGVAQWSRGRMRICGRPEGLKNPIVRAIMEDRHGRMWIGSSSGLFQLDRKTFRLSPVPPGELNHVMIFFIMEDADGTQWVGSNGGLWRRDPSGYARVGNEQGLKTALAFCAARASDGGIWVGTDMGLLRIRGSNIQVVTSRQGLHNNVISQVIEDREQNLWLSTIRGIARIKIVDFAAFEAGRIRQLKPTVFGISDGMKTTETSGGSSSCGFLSRDGKLWFPTLKGLVMFDPARFSKNEIPPPIVIEEVVVNNRKVQMDRGVEFAAGTRNFEFHYTALSLLDPNKNRFRYKLDNLDTDWIDAGNRRSAYYTNLPPGRYTFRVVGCNNDEVWNLTGASFSFYLRPRFTQTLWFLLLIGMALSSLAFGAYRLRVRQLRMKEKKLASMVKERTQELADTNFALKGKTNLLEEANQKLEQISNLDGLTGIANRRFFEQFVELEWKRMTREQKPLSFIMIDVDFFKSYNDRYGHLTGDDCLKKVTGSISIAHRPGDLVARYGGEEFIVVIPNTDATGAFHLAEKMRQGVEKLSIRHEGRLPEGNLTISLGVATQIPNPGSHYTELLLVADMALYQAKHDGRNRTHMAMPAVP